MGSRLSCLVPGSPSVWQSVCHESAGVSGDMREGTSAGHTGALMGVSG